LSPNVGFNKLEKILCNWNYKSRTSVDKIYRIGSYIEK
jgi:hypothetical protein